MENKNTILLESSSLYHRDLSNLISNFRQIIKNEKLPILIGELGYYSKSPKKWQMINDQIKIHINSDPYSKLILSNELKHKGDHIHFNSNSQRVLGQRYADTYLKEFK